MRSASGRLAQISALMNQINATSDQKAVLEIQARIGAENAMLDPRGVADPDAAGHGRQRGAHRPLADRERQYEMLGRTGRISDYLPEPEPP